MTLFQLIKGDKNIHGDNGKAGYINEIRKKITKHPISDITDDKGYQYVDLVLEGGGVLGIALAGYTYTLEQAGIRFLNLAGTSAGAINALIFAALGYSWEPKSEELIRIFEKMNFNSFIDGGDFAQALAQDLQENDDFLTSMLPKLGALGLLGKFRKNKFGINPGVTFEKWLEELLEEKDVFSTKDLFNKLKNNNLKIRDEKNRKDLPADKTRLEQDFQTNELAIIASDITTESKIIFPKMGYLYWDNPLETHPKKYVRASMAIPLFFEPVRLDHLPKGREDHWKALTGFEGSPPDIAYLVDGGVTSNFPIDVFHSHDCIPLCPTFGVKLGVDRKEALKLDGIKEYASALFDTARHNADYSFILNNDDYKQLITSIDTSPQAQENLEDFGWLEFDMPNDKKERLFAIGAKAARDFICGNKKWAKDPKQLPLPLGAISPFDWKAYKELRDTLSAAIPPGYQAKKDKIKKFSLLPKP
ncbi:Patatin-like phospholipase [compost metagenome]